MPAENNQKELAWVALVRAHARALTAVEAALKKAGLPSLCWYDVLWELERRGEQRPRDLQTTLLMPQSNLSRLLDRMEAAELVCRSRCPVDGRGQVVRATEKGLATRKRMWPIYSAAIENQFDLSAAQRLKPLLNGVGRF